MTLNFLSNFKFYFDSTEGLFYKSKEIVMYHQRTMKMYLPDQNMNHQNEEYAIMKILFWIYYEINPK